jgi:exopolysaccharide biosynthesis polyprenyl glycosylphosphotransferase
VIAVAWAAAIFVRFRSPLFPPADDPASWDAYLLLGAGMLPIWHWLLRKRGLYEPRRGKSRLEETRSLIEVSTIATCILAGVTFFLRQTEVSRLVLALSWGLATSGLVAVRTTLRTSLSYLRVRGWNQRSVLLVGTRRLAHAVSESLRAHPETGFRVIGFVGPRPIPEGGEHAPWLGWLEDAARIVREQEVDHVIVALERSEPADVSKILRELERSTASIRIVPDLEGFPAAGSGIEELSGIPMMRLVESPLLGWNRVIKRGFDLFLAAGLLVVLSPLMLVIAAAIRRDSADAPILYRQRRMGLDGRLFQILKFRTMIPDAEAETGPRWAKPDDPRCTPIGRCLRRFNLDELPQLWNVLRGDMSLVGPRPERPELVRQFMRHVPSYMLRHKVKAGMTGWAQVNGWRGDSSIEKRLQHDIDYVQRWSLWFDVKILCLTLARSFRDPNAY